MINTNEYFDGKVKSLSLENKIGKHTVGVMVAGEYNFTTGSPETMNIVCGSWEYQLPGSSEWFSQSAGSSFEVDANITFKVKTSEPCAYLCRYE